MFIKQNFLLRVMVFAAMVLSPPKTLWAQSSESDITSAILPAIMMLLEDEQVRLRVGQQYATNYTASRYPDGIEFTLGRLTLDVEVAIDFSDIPVSGEVELYINGVFVRRVVNGRNTFTIPASALNPNLIEIRVKDGTSSAWRISRISLLLLEGAPRSRAQAQQFLVRATFGPTKSELDRVMEVGYESWVDQQLSLPRSNSLADFNAHFERLKTDVAIDVTNNGPTQSCIRRELTGADCISFMHALLKGSGASRVRLDQWWQRTIRNTDQLRQRTVFALSQILVTSVNLGNSLRGRNRAVVVYEDVLSKHAFGNYRDLLKDVTLNPAMAFYLSFVGNQRAGPRGLPDENYAREIMQLFSIGLVELNIDGTPKLDTNGQEIETYSPETIQNLARVFTGWTYASGNFDFETWDLDPLRVFGTGSLHDPDRKVVLGTVHPAGLSPEEDIDLALDTIFNHPNVGPFIATRLIERLVMSNPPPAYVERVALKFNDNGNGVRGDLGAVVKAILLAPEAFASVDSPQGGKVKEPIIAVSQLWRAFNAQSDIGDIRDVGPHTHLGQRPFDAPTVFNFYAPTDAPSDVAQLGLVAPEMTLFKDDIVLNYLRRMFDLAISNIVGTDPVTPTAPYSEDTRRAMVLNLSEAKQFAHDSNALLNFYSERLFGGIMSDHLRSVTIAFLDELPVQDGDDANRQYRAEQALTVLLVSPEYNIQR